LELYRQALELAGADPSLRSLAREIELTVQDVEKRIAAQPSRPQPAIPPLPPGAPFGEDKGLGVSSKEPKVGKEPRGKSGLDLFLLWGLVGILGGSVSVWISTLISQDVIFALTSDGYTDFFLGNIITPAVMRRLHGNTSTLDIGLTGMLGAIQGALFGIIFGFAQWLVLRRHVLRASSWVPASAIGWSIALLTNSILNNEAVESPLRLMGLIMAGATVGLPQWLVLRRQIHRSKLWVLTCAMVFPIGLTISSVIVNEIYDMFLEFSVDFVIWTISDIFLPGAIFGTSIGFFTAPILIWLLRQPRPEEKNASR
jgi:hypothetical protein